MTLAKYYKALRYKLSKYIHNKEDEELFYVVHENSISLQDSHNSLNEVAKQISTLLWYAGCYINQFYYTLSLLDY